MLRRIALVTFVSAIVLVAACGRQVTPDPTLNIVSNLAGRIVVRFRTKAPLDFVKYTYAIVIDTCGGRTPYPNAFATTFNDYSFSFLVGGASGTALPALVQYVLTPGSSNSLNPLNVPLGASTTQLVLNSDQQNSEFQLTFVRAQLANPLGVAQQCPNIVPSATAAPGPQPTTLAQASWSINFFTIDNTSKVVVDSLGLGGAQDTSFNGAVIDTNVTRALSLLRLPGSTLPADTHAQIDGGEIDNFQ